MRRWFRVIRIAPDYLRTVARHEWQTMVLALVGLAPGVAALTAWTEVALLLNRTDANQTLQPGLLPPFLLEALGAGGVLVGTGMVTLLIGCLGLANVYLASIERRLGELALLSSLGLRRREVMALLLLEALAAGLLGDGVGLLLGVGLSWLSWPAAQAYFNIDAPYALSAEAVLVGAVAGVLAALLFMSVAAITATVSPAVTLRGDRLHLFNTWRELKTTITGAFFAAALTFLVALPVLDVQATLVLSGLALLLAALLSGGSWALTNLYRRLPTPVSTPLWTLAVQGLARHPDHTTGMVLALTAAAYGVGITALTWLDGTLTVAFPVWVSGVILVASAGLVLAIAALAALERRWEFGLLMALGARAGRVRHVILLEYAIVALGSGAAGALLALFNWAGSGGHGGWPGALGLVAADLLAALISAWTGAAPVLWVVSRRSIEQTVR